MWRSWLNELKKGHDIRLNLAQLMAEVRQHKRRRLLVRVYITQGINSISESKTSEYFEKAADTLLFMLKRPKLARVLYERAAQKSADSARLKKIVESLTPKQEMQKPAPITVRLAPEPRPQQMAAKAPAAKVSILREHLAKAQNSERRPANVSEAANTEALDPAKIDQVMIALKNLSEKVKESSEDNKPALFEQLSELLVVGKASAEKINDRLKLLMPYSLASKEFCEVILSTLRGKERFASMAFFLARLIEKSSGPQKNAFQLELGQVLRFGVRDVEGAVVQFETLVTENAADRQAWGELLECLDDLGDRAKLAQMLEKKISISSGLEQKTFQQAHTEVLEKIQSVNEMMRSSIAPNVHRTLTGIHQSADA